MFQIKVFSVVLIGLVTLCGGCFKPTEKSVSQGRLENEREFNEIFRTIKDMPSAIQAKPKIKELGNRAKELNRRADQPGHQESDNEKQEFVSELKKLKAEWVVIVQNLPKDDPELKKLIYEMMQEYLKDAMPSKNK